MPNPNFSFNTVAPRRRLGRSRDLPPSAVPMVTHPKVFKRPSLLSDTVAFAAQARDQPNCVRIETGPRQGEISTRLCIETDVKGNLAPDAYLAAIAIETGCEWVSTDRDFSRFSSLRRRHPIM